MKRKILVTALTATLSVVPAASIIYSYSTEANSVNVEVKKRINRSEELVTVDNNYEILGIKDKESIDKLRKLEAQSGTEIRSKQNIQLMKRDSDNKILVDQNNQPIYENNLLSFSSVSIGRKYLDKYLADVEEYNNLYPDSAIIVDNDELNSSFAEFKRIRDYSEALSKKLFYDTIKELDPEVKESYELLEKQDNISWNFKNRLLQVLDRKKESPFLSNADGLSKYLSVDSITIPGSLRKDSSNTILKSISLNDSSIYENNQDLNTKAQDDESIHHLEFTIHNISRMSAAWGSVDLIDKSTSKIIVSKGSAAIPPGSLATYKFDVPKSYNLKAEDVRLKWNTRANFPSTALESVVAYNKENNIVGKITYGAVSSSAFDFVKYDSVDNEEFIFNKEEHYNVSRIEFGIQNPTRSSWGGRWSFRITDRETGTKIWNSPTTYLAPNTSQTFSYELKNTNSKSLNIKNAILDWFPRYDFHSSTKLLFVSLYDDHGNLIDTLNHNSTNEFHKEMVGFVDVDKSSDEIREQERLKLKEKYAINNPLKIKLEKPVPLFELDNSLLNFTYYTKEQKAESQNEEFLDTVRRLRYSFDLVNKFYRHETVTMIHSNLKEKDLQINGNEYKVSMKDLILEANINFIKGVYYKAKELEKDLPSHLALWVSRYLAYPADNVYIKEDFYSSNKDADYNLESVNSFNNIKNKPDFYDGTDTDKNFALITNNPSDEVPARSTKDVQVQISDLVDMNPFINLWKNNKFEDGVKYFNSNYKKEYSSFFSDGLNQGFVMGDKPFSGFINLDPSTKLVSSDEELGKYLFNIYKADWGGFGPNYTMNLEFNQYKHDEDQKTILRGLGLNNIIWDKDKKEQFIIINSSILNNNKEYIDTIDNLIKNNDNNKVLDQKVDSLIDLSSSLFANANQEFMYSYKDQSVINNNSIGITYSAGDYNLKIIFNK